MECSFENRVVLSGNITPESLEKFMSRFSEVIWNTDHGDEITLVIDSPGGDTHTSLGIYDLIADSDRNVTGLVVGRAQSGATLILQACSRRLMTRHSHIMLHRSKIDLHGMNIEDAFAAIQTYKEMDEIFYRVFAERSNRSIDEIRELSKRDMYFYVEEALEAGLVDGIYEG